MHIGIFTDSYLPYTSGVVRSIIVFTNELRRRGHRVSIFAPTYGNRKEKEENDIYRFPSLRAPTFKEFALAIPLAPSLSRRLDDLKIDLIHVHSPFIMGRVGAYMAKRMGVPLVFTYHTLYEEYVHYFPFIPRLMRHAVRNYTISFGNRCQLVIAPTNPIAEYLREHGVHVPVITIPTGIELERFQNLDSTWLRQHLNLPPEKIILLHVGRLGKEKNMPFLLKSFAMVRREEPTTHLVLVGSGPLKEELQNLVSALKINQSVTFAGQFPFEQMPNVYAGADLFIFASLTETQGLVIGEAKAAGLPVVAVKAFGVQDMVKNGEDGFLTPHDINTFANAVIQLVKDINLRRQMGRQARQNAIELAASAMAGRLEAQYKSLLAL